MTTTRTPRRAALTAALAAAGLLYTLAPAQAGTGGGGSTPYTVGGLVTTWTGDAVAGRPVTISLWYRAPATGAPDRTWHATTDQAGNFSTPLDGIYSSSPTLPMPTTIQIPNGGITQTTALVPLTPGINAVNIALNDPPSAPTGANITPIPGGVGLTWTPPALTGGLALTSYTARWNSPDGQTATCTTPASTTWCQLTGLTAGTTGTIRITASNPVGEGPGLTFTASTAAAAPPAVPQDPTTPDPYTRPAAPKPVLLKLTKGKHRPGHRLTVRWHARNTTTVRLSWQRGTGKAHTQDTTPSGRITLAGPPGTRYYVRLTAGTATAAKTYRIR